MNRQDAAKLAPKGKLAGKLKKPGAPPFPAKKDAPVLPAGASKKLAGLFGK